MPRHLVGEGDRLTDPWTATDDAGGRAQRDQLVVKLCDLATEPLPLDRLSHDEQHLVGAERFGDEVVGPAPNRLQRRLVVAVGAHHDHERRAAHLLVLLEEREPVETRACARRR
jgi:hypothetical protein